MRRIDHEAAQRATAIVAISAAVGERIRRFYGRDAIVVHPPVDIHEFSGTESKDPELFLCVGRLVPYKAPERIIAAFADLPYRLVIVGEGPLSARLQRDLPDNVTLHPWLPRTELVKLFARGSGFVHIAEEDFGIAMVEALASGMPVLGLGRGGAVDIVRPGDDGVLIDEPEVADIRRGVRALAEGDWDRAALVRRSHRFARPRFVREMSELVRAAMSSAS
jgi:glycosyltransferase involved in cell wall biosynthesis